MLVLRLFREAEDREREEEAKLEREAAMRKETSKRKRQVDSNVGANAL